MVEYLVEGRLWGYFVPPKHNEETMRIPITTIDGQPNGTIELTMAVDKRILADGRAVLATRQLGGRIALIVEGGTQYIVALADYVQVRREAMTNQHLAQEFERSVHGSTIPHPDPSNEE